MTVRLLFLWLLPFTVAAAGEPLLNYLYVVAAEGNASGGHVAVQFDDAVYHFQHVDGGFIRLYRDGVQDFEYRYRFLENRDLDALRLTVPSGVFARLRQRFERRYQIQRLQFSLAALLAQEEAWLSAIAAGRPVSLELPAAGLFFDKLSAADEPTAAREAVLARLAARLGTAFLEARLRAVDAALAHLRPVTWVPARFVSDDPARVPAAPYAFSERYQDLLVLRLALQALRQARPLRPGVLQTPGGAAFRLTPEGRSALCAFRGVLERSIARLVQEAHADTGAALAILLARLIAVSRSCHSGRLAFLDRFGFAASAIPAHRISTDPAFWRPLVARAAARLRADLQALARRHDSGVRYAELEASANRYLELVRGLAGGRPLRLFGVEPLPDRPLRGRRVVILPTPLAEEALAPVRQARQRWQASLRRLYRYDLLQRNCVTEALHALGVPARFASGDFIPFRSVAAVARRYPVGQRRHLLSYRHARLRQRYRQAPAWRVYLREFNTLTSTLYRPNGEDSVFVFFTDDVVWPRPLYGSVNAGVGLVLTAAGLATLPFDRGELLQRSARGLFSSLAELVFCNVRKGSYLYLPPAPARLVSP